MSVIFLLISISLLVALVFLGAFIWAVKAGQYNDSYGPSVRMLFDSESKIHQIDTKKTDPKSDPANVDCTT